MLIFNLPLVTKETIRYAESIAGFCTLLFVDQWSVNFIFLNASCDLWEIIGYLLCILYTVQYIVQSITLLSSGLAEVQNKLASLLMRQLELMNYSQSILGINHIHCIVLLMYV